MSSVCDAWVGKRKVASNEVNAVDNASRAFASSAFAVRSRRLRWSAMMPITLASGAMSTSTPSMVTMPRASSVNDGGMARFCVRSTSNTSMSARPTSISDRFTVAYAASSRPRRSSSRP